MALRIEPTSDGGVRLWIKAVPGASRDQVAGILGDRLKVRVSASPEGGKANKAVSKLLAKALGVKANQIAIESGQGNPEKVVRITGVSAHEIRRRLSESSA